MSSDPFRSELEAAHQRIEKLERDHKARVGELERENARLRKRLLDAAPPSRSKTGKTFFAIGMMTLGVSLVAGMFFARVARVPEPTPVWASPSIELPDELVAGNTSAAPGDFDKDAVALVLNAVHLDCVPPGTSGHAKVTFDPSGTVSLVTVDAPLGNNAIAMCVEQRYRNARIPPFSGPPRVVGKSFSVK